MIGIRDVMKGGGVMKRDSRHSWIIHGSFYCVHVKTYRLCGRGVGLSRGLVELSCSCWVDLTNGQASYQGCDAGLRQLLHDLGRKLLALRFGEKTSSEDSNVSMHPTLLLSIIYQSAQDNVGRQLDSRSRFGVDFLPAGHGSHCIATVFGSCAAGSAAVRVPSLPGARTDAGGGVAR